MTVPLGQPWGSGARRPTRLRLVSTGLVILAAALSGLAPLIAGAALRVALSRDLRTADVRVGVATWPPPALWAGRIDVLSVAARHLRLGALAVDAFDAQLGGVRLDPRALYLARVLVIRQLRSGVAHVTVSQDALRDLLAARPPLHDVSVGLGPGVVRVGATLPVLGAPLRATGEGHLVLRGGTMVDLVLDRVAVAGIPLPPAAAGEVAGAVNPILDVRSLPFSLRLVTLVVGDGRATLDAVVDRR